MVGRNRPGESKKLLSSPCGSLSKIALREPVRRELVLCALLLHCHGAATNTRSPCPPWHCFTIHLETRSRSLESFFKVLCGIAEVELLCWDRAIEVSQGGRTARDGAPTGAGRVVWASKPALGCAVLHWTVFLRNTETRAKLCGFVLGSRQHLGAFPLVWW